MASFKMSPFSFAVERDLRLDLLRGLGLWMIFLDHIPDDVVAWLTLRNYGFSDAAEFFVFMGTGPTNTALVNCLPVSVRAILSPPMPFCCQNRVFVCM